MFLGFSKHGINFLDNELNDEHIECTSEEYLYIRTKVSKWSKRYTNHNDHYYSSFNYDGRRYDSVDFYYENYENTDLDHYALLVMKAGNKYYNERNKWLDTSFGKELSSCKEELYNCFYNK